MTPAKWRIWPLTSNDLIYAFFVIQWAIIGYGHDNDFGMVLAG